MSELWRDSEGARAFKMLATRQKCIWCSTKFDKPLVLPTGQPYPANIMPNAEFLFHAEDTHGYPHEIVWEDWMLKKMGLA